MTNRRAKRARKQLLDILSISRPHNSEAEVQFCRDYLDRIEGMQRDEFGNRYVRIGAVPVMWSCHVDTVAHQDKAGPQDVSFDPTTGFAYLTDNATPKRSLGADDGAGVWLMLQMIAARRPGLYLFHRGEEVGCLGSRYILAERPDLLQGITFAVALDRQGTDSIITHQTFGMTASDKFAWSLARQLNASNASFKFKPDDTGVYTDTNEYAGVIAECSNLSVGYYGQHSCREELDVYFVEALRDALLRLDVGDLECGRQAGDDGWGEDDMRGYADDVGTDDYAGGDWLETLVRAVRENPRGAAWLLYNDGRDAFDVLEAEDEMGLYPSAHTPNEGGSDAVPF